MSIRLKLALWLAPKLQIDYNRMRELIEQVDYYDDSYSGLMAQISELKDQTEKMKYNRDPENEKEIVVKLRNKINDVFVSHHRGVADRDRAIDKLLERFVHLVRSGQIPLYFDWR